MLKKLLLVLDAGPTAVYAKAAAFRLAAAQSATLTALALIDTRPLEAGEPTPAGGSAFLEKRNAQWHSEWLDAARRRIDAFRDEAAAAGVAHASLIVEDSAPHAALARLAREHDLVVAASDSHFGAEARPHDRHWLDDYLLDAPRPMLLFPPSFRPQKPGDGGTLVAYDGSASAARALQQLAFLDAWRDGACKLVSLHPHQIEAERLASEGSAYLATHGLPCEALAISGPAKPQDILLAETESQRAALLVMGAFGHRSWRERLFGSTTDALLRHSRCPLLLCH